MKMCKYHSDKRCYHSSCDFMDGMGNVVVCPLFSGGDMFTRRSVKPVLVSVWSKHLRGGS